MTKKRYLFALAFLAWSASIVFDTLPLDVSGNVSDVLEFFAQFLFVVWSARIMATLVIKHQKNVSSKKVKGRIVGFSVLPD